MSTPKERSIYLSILIPVYNVESYLALCLDSVLAQDVSGIEVICVNDCSTDNSLSILRDYQARYSSTLRVIALDENLGLSHARNLLLSQAQGDYIWFVDSDDWIENAAIKTLKPLIQSNSYDVILFDMLREKKAGVLKSVSCFPVKPNELISSKDTLVKKTFQSKKLFPWLRVFKREVWCASLAYPDGQFFEDVCVTPKLMSLCRTAVYINKPLYFYRDNAQGIMATPNVKKIQDLSSGLLSLNDFWAQKKYEPSNSVCNAFYIFSVYNYLGAYKMLEKNNLYTLSLHQSCYQNLLNTTQKTRSELIIRLILNAKLKCALRLFKYSL